MKLNIYFLFFKYTTDLQLPIIDNYKNQAFYTSLGK